MGNIPVYLRPSVLQWEDCWDQYRIEGDRRLHSSLTYSLREPVEKYVYFRIWVTESALGQWRYWLENSEGEGVATATHIHYLKDLVKGLLREKFKELVDALG